MKKLNLLRVICLLFCFGTLPDIEAAEDPVSARGEASQKDIRNHKNFSSWQRLLPEEKDKMRSDMQKFHRLPEGKQRSMQGNYDHWKNLSPEKQLQLRSKFARWRQLSPQVKDRLRLRAKSR